ncbi:hypothetical protein D3C76_1775780 [compost metagenome]
MRDAFDVPVNDFGRTVLLNQQHRFHIKRQTEAREFVHDFHRSLIHEFNGGGDDFGRDDGFDGFGRIH